MFRKAFDKDGRLEVVAEAADGKQAIEAVAKHRPDALLLDFGMPGTSGVEVLRSLREQNPDMAIVVVSGFSAMGEEAMQMGATAFISKSDRVADAIQALVKSVWRDADVEEEHAS